VTARLYPTDNEWDIPSLRPDRQATEIEAPALAWGTVSRSARMPGTWVLYVDDARFTALLREPARLVATGCAAAVEPNMTLHEQTPRWEVIAAVGQKRACARAWQDAGVRVFVDLNVPRRHRDLCMLGVPAGWRAFATRGYAGRLDDLRDEHDVACTWAGGIPLMLVYGGGDRVEATCRELAGAVYVPDHHAQRRAVAECSPNPAKHHATAENP
jgi:hypothetical protein